MSVRNQAESHFSKARPSRTRGYAYFISFVAAVGGFLFGYDLAIIAGAQIFLREYFHLSPGQFGFATSSAVLGCIAGPFLGSHLCDRIGRKRTLLVAAGLFAAGTIGTAVPNSIGLFNLFRVVGGLGVGLASLASPMYIAEAAPARIRGRLGILYQLAITIGALSATIVSYYVASTNTDASSNWRWMFASMLLPILIFVILLTRVPRSPRWLAERGQFDEALAILTRINGPEIAQKEMDDIRLQASLKETGSFRDLVKPGIRMALFVGICLAIFNNWTGWSGVAYYLPTLFQMGGYENASDAIAATFVPMIANVFLTLVAIWLVERAGRRPLWLGASLAMVASLTLLGLVFYAEIKGPFVILAVLLVVAPHAIGLGPLPWLMMSELFPTRVRAKAVSVTTTFLWVAGFTGPLAFPKLVEVSNSTIGSPAGLFWMYAILALLAFLFGWKYLPETRGRTLEEIARSWGVADAEEVKIAPLAPVSAAAPPDGRKD